MNKEQVLEFRKMFRSQHIPSWYNGTVHVLFNFSVLGVILFALLWQVQDASLKEWLIMPFTLIFGNLSVYVIHRFPLHHHLPLIHEHTYKIHTKWHHHFYTDQLVIYESRKDFYILFFPPFVVVGFALFFLPAVYFGLGQVLSHNALFLMMATSTLYFILYEILHYISHLPETHWILSFPYFRLMWQHHVDHHNPKLMQNFNFNIVFPFFDYVFGTVYKKAKTP